MSNAGNPVIAVSAEIAHVSAVTEFVETTAIAMGLGRKEAMALTLASEEVFAYLCASVTLTHDISISCSDGSYYVQLDFLFDAEDIDIGAFNLTAKVSLDDEASLDEMGLLIASRTVDRFCFTQKAGALSKLTLVCNKQYSASSPTELREPADLADYAVLSPENDAIEAFARRVWALSSTQLIPAFFEFPGKVVDMIRSGEFAMGVAQGASRRRSFGTMPDKMQGETGGGIVWTRSDAKTVECFGPYLFGQEAGSEMAADLVDFCISGIARTTAVGLWSRFPASLPPGYFESLGELEMQGSDGSASVVTVSFRQTKDDPGCVVCTDAGLESFLRDKYTQLAFPREIKTDGVCPETRSLRSVIAVDLNRAGVQASTSPRGSYGGQATLRPVLVGSDCAENLAGHLGLLLSEKVGNILFEIDLGESWQASFVPALLANNMQPRVLLPYAGKGDIVVFQLDRARL